MRPPRAEPACTLPPRAHSPDTPLPHEARFDGVARRERTVVARLINPLTQFRCVATRHEKCTANHQATSTVAAALTGGWRLSRTTNVSGPGMRSRSWRLDLGIERPHAPTAVHLVR